MADVREELRRRAAAADDNQALVAVIESSFYECGFRKCWCSIEGRGPAWVIIRCGSDVVSLCEGSKIQISQPYHERRVDDQDVLLVSHARNL